MHLYIANATHHVVAFLYRIPEQPVQRTQHIAIGSQIRLPEDLRQEDIDAILRQHERYGLISVEAVGSVKEFSGMCYSIDKPVPSIKIETLMDHNRGELIELGRKIRQEAAVVMNNETENALEQAGGFLNNMDVEIVEETNPQAGEEPIAEGFRLRREGENQYGPARNSRRRR